MFQHIFDSKGGGKHYLIVQPTFPIAVSDAHTRQKSENHGGMSYVQVILKKDLCNVTLNTKNSSHKYKTTF